MNYTQLLVTKQDTDNGLIVCLKPKTSYVMAPVVIQEIRALQKQLVSDYYSNPWDHILYIIWCYYPGNITLKGMDFSFIYTCLQRGDRDSIRNYVNDIFELLFLNYIGLGLPVINCSFVERPFCGCNREFFFMNQINFIKKNFFNHPLACQDNDVEPVDIKSSIKKSYFPSSIYEDNAYYVFSRKNLDKMKEIITAFPFKTRSPEELNNKKMIFDMKKEETLNKIFSAYDKDNNIIKKFSDLQKYEHNCMRSKNL